MKKRILSIALVMVMFVSMFGVFNLTASAGNSTDVANLKANDVITVGKYDVKTKNYTLGQIKVIEKTVKNTKGKYVSYNVLDSTTFTANEDAVSEKTKSALKLIEQAVNEVFVERKNDISYSPFGNVDSMSAPYSLTVSPYAVTKLEAKGISSSDYIWLAVGNKAGKVQSVYTNVFADSTIKYTISDTLYAKGIRFAGSDSQTITAEINTASYNVNSFADLVDADGNCVTGFYWKNASEAIGYTNVSGQETEKTLAVDQSVSVVNKNKSVIKNISFKAGTNLEFVAESFDLNVAEAGDKYIEVAKYNVAKDSYTAGQIKIIKKDTLDTNRKPVSYYVLDSTSFVADDGTVEAKTKSDLKSIQQAVNEVFVERKSYISYAPFGNVDSKSAPYSLTISPYAVPKLEQKGINPTDYIWLAVGNKAGKVLTVYTNFVAGTVQEPEKVSVTAVSVSATDVALNTGDSQDVSAIINPSNAENQNVTWTVENSSIATIAYDGLNCKITGVSAGSTRVTVTTADGSYTASINVNVADNSVPTGGSFTVESLNTSFGTNNTISAWIRVTNTSTKDISLNDLKLQYLYNNDGNINEVFECDWTGNNHRDISSIVKGEPNYNSETRISDVEITFADSSEMLKAGEILEIHFRVHTPNWADYDLTNDYSQTASSEYQATDKVLLYYQSDLISGVNNAIPAELPVDSGLAVESQNTTFGSNNTIAANMKVTNNSDKDISLNDLKLQYVYNNDGNTNEVFQCDWAGNNNRYISPIVQGSASYSDSLGTSVVEIKFADSSEVLKVGETLEIHFRVYPSNWAAYDLSNDYSQGTSDYQTTDKILLYYQNKLASGEYHAS